MNDGRYIVAEIARTWPARFGQVVQASDYIGHSFESVLTRNEARGYRLHSWKFSQVVQHDGWIHETIVAVFEWSATSSPETTERKSALERAAAICRCYFDSEDESDEERLLYEALESVLGSEEATANFVMGEARS